MRSNISDKTDVLLLSAPANAGVLQAVLSVLLLEMLFTALLMASISGLSKSFAYIYKSSKKNDSENASDNAVKVYYLPTHQAYIIECQRLFILKGTSSILTIKESRKGNVRRLHSVVFAYGLVPPFSVFL